MPISWYPQTAQLSVNKLLSLQNSTTAVTFSAVSNFRFHLTKANRFHLTMPVYADNARMTANSGTKEQRRTVSTCY